MSLINLDHPYLNAEEEIAEKANLTAIGTPFIERILRTDYDYATMDEIMRNAWLRYDEILPTITTEEKFPQGPMTLHRIAAFDMALYHELIASGMPEKKVKARIHDIGWQGYEVMSEMAWKAASVTSQDPFMRMQTALHILWSPLCFDPESYDWKWEEPDSENRSITVTCHRCPIVEFFHAHGLADLCTTAFCDQDYAMANVWASDFKRSQSIAYELAGSDEYKDKPKECEFTLVSRQSEPMRDFKLMDVFS